MRPRPRGTRKTMFTTISSTVRSTEFATTTNKLSILVNKTFREKEMRPCEIKAQDILHCELTQNALQDIIGELKTGEYLNTTNPEILKRQYEITGQFLSYLVDYEPHEEIDALIDEFNTYRNKNKNMPYMKRVEGKNSYRK